MATNPEDVFAAIRVGGSQAASSTPERRPQSAFDEQAPADDDVFAPLRITANAPNINRGENTLGEEFRAGLGSGIDSLQAGLYGTAGLMGRELGIGWMEKAGMDGAAEQFAEAADAGRQSKGFSDIESAGGFFKWAAASLGEAVPSLALAMTGSGIGARVGLKAVELGVKKSLARSVERRLVLRHGFAREEALVSARDYMLSDAGRMMLARAVSGERTGAIIRASASKAMATGGAAGGAAVAALPQIGQIDQELIGAGIADPGLTALVGGVLGGALEAVPALRLLDKMFPGVDRQVSKEFVKDFAVSTGVQTALEGTTEAAQEIIQLAALAYHDPTFDMFSPDARRRVIDAFAAGALVGAVTGAAAEGVGAVQSGAFAGAKVAAPKLKAWSMTAADTAKAGVAAAGVAVGKAEAAVESQLPEGFVAADNTLFEEIKGRVFGAIQPRIEAAVNSLQAQVQAITDNLDENLEGGVNQESAKLSDLAKAAHEKFLKEHGAQLEQAKAYALAQVKRIAEGVKALKNDPKAREEYINQQVEAVKERLAGAIDMFRRKAAERDKKFEAEVDNMDLDDDLLDQLGYKIEENETRTAVNPVTKKKYQQNVGPEVQQESPLGRNQAGETSGQGDIAQVGETDAAPVLTFGKFQKRPKYDVSGKEVVVGYDNKPQAEKGRRALRERYRQEIPFTEGTTQDDSFRIIKNPNGKGWVIEVINEEVKATEKFFSDLKSIERSGGEIRDNPRAIRIEGLKDPKRFGFQASKKGFDIDVQTMAYKGKNLDKTASTDMQGFLAFAGEMMQRGMIDNDQFAKMREKAEEVFSAADKESVFEQKRIASDLAKVENQLKNPKLTAKQRTVLSSRQNALKNSLGARKSFDERTSDAEKGIDSEFAPPVGYDSRGAAFAALSEFKEELTLQGVEYPFTDKFEGAGWDVRPVNEDGSDRAPMGNKLFFVRKDEKTGDWMWGFNQTEKGAAVFKGLKAKNPSLVAVIMDAMRNRRRDEALDKAAREEGAFSGNAYLSGGGNLGDTTGATAGPARIASDPIRTGRAGGERTSGIDADAQERSNDPAVASDESGQQSFGIAGFGTRMADPNDPNSGNQRVSRKLEDTDPQADDLVTDPDELPPEFAVDRKEEMKGESSHKNKQTAKSAKTPNRKTARGRAGDTMEQTEKDNRLLKRWARKGSVKMMLSENLPDGVVEGLTELANFVTKTLGLSNQVTVIDDAGLQLLIDQGLVTHPSFLETLNDPNVHARNIRIDDNSFVYLSSKILSDPVIATLAFGHEMGHHVYSVAWDNLTPEAQARLKQAFVDHTVSVRNSAGKKIKNPKFTDDAAMDQIFSEKGFDAEFNEWMADQLAAWITNPRLPQGPVQAFFAKVGAQIRRLYDFISKNERFQLNETFKEFADAVALKALTTSNTGANPYNDAIMKAWFRNEGVTMYRWFGKAMQEKDKVGPAKNNRTKTEKEPHTIGERQDMAYRKSLEIDRAWEQLDSIDVGATEAVALAEAHIDELQRELAVIDKEIVDQLNRSSSAKPEVDNMAFDFTPVTQKSKDALARVEKNYPLIAKRAAALRNWMVAAYNMVLAPSTGVVRDIGLRIEAANELVSIFHRELIGKPKGKVANYHQDVNLMRGQFSRQYSRLAEKIEADIKRERPDIKNAPLQVLVNARMREIGRSLQKKDGNPSATFTTDEQAIRDIFENMHKYALEAGLPVGKVINYYPRQFNVALLIENKQKILDHLTLDKPGRRGMSVQGARSRYNALIDPHSNDGRATTDATETPGFKHMNSRRMQDKWFDQFLEDNTQAVVANYINQVVKRAEFNRRLGENWTAGGLTAYEAISKGLWDPKGKMHRILADAKQQNASDQDLVILEKYIDANLGQLGRDDIKPGVRKFMAGMMAYQNMRVLMFTVFASLPDLVGPAIRAGSMKNAFTSMKNNMHDIAKTDGDLAEMARTLGIIQDAASEHIMTEYVDNHYMPPTLRKWNDAFFKYTGLNWYTDFTRKAALAVGVDYLQNSYEQSQSSDPKTSARGKDMLAELGVTPQMIAKWNADGRPTYNSQSHDLDSGNRMVAEALVQFVDESIMRPNAAQRPILASHPAAMLMFHLKGYMYAVNDIILKRIKFNIDEAETPAQIANAFAPAIFMMLMTAIGLELRELVQYAGSNRQPPTDRMDGWEYTWELAQRSGLTGVGQIALDFQGAEDRGMSHVAGIGGPTLSQAADIISRPSSQTIPKAIPIVGQIPALRDAVRTMM